MLWTSRKKWAVATLPPTLSRCFSVFCDLCYYYLAFRLFPPITSSVQLFPYLCLTNPQLFAAGYGACFMGAMSAMAPGLKARQCPIAFTTPPHLIRIQTHFAIRNAASLRSIISLTRQQLQVPATTTVDARVTFGPNKVRHMRFCSALVTFMLHSRPPSKATALQVSSSISFQPFISSHRSLPSGT